MKRQIFFILSLVLCVLTASATPVSKSKAQAIATSFFQRGAKTTRATGVAARFCKEYASRKDAPAALYAFSSGESVVFVSAEDEMPAILGYSERADLDNLPPAMEWLLNSYALLTDAVRNGEIEAPKLYASADAVEPLCKTIWDQVEPFNSLCPVIKGQLSANGCLSTAFAQVMKFHEWPKKAEGTTPEYYSNDRDLIPSVNLSDHVYNWADMLNDYTGTYTKEQGQAVAQLCYDVSVASRMNFGEASGTQLDKGGLALRKYFGYSKDLYIDYAAYYSEEEWVAKLKNEISQKRPVLFSAITEGSPMSQLGHCFVIDGYNADGLFHVNWGWSGESNDYYLITALDPPTQGVGGTASGRPYSLAQQALFNCVPDITGTSVPAEHYRFDCARLGGRGGDNLLISGFKNNSLDDFQGKLMLQLIDKDGKVVGQQTIISDYFARYIKVVSDTVASLKDFDFSGIADGVYDTKLIAVSDATGNEFPAFVTEHNSPIEVQDGKLKSIINNDAILEGKILNCEFAGIADFYLNIKVKVQVKNTSDVSFVDSISGLQVYGRVFDPSTYNEGYDTYRYKKEIKPGELVEFEQTLYIGYADDEPDQHLLQVNLNYPNGIIDEKEYPLKDLITTALNDAKADKELNSAPAYNTMGQRVNPKTAKGIIIQNGKKTLGL